LTSTPSAAANYEWSGTSSFSSTIQNPTITSPLAGNYTFTVKVTNSNGCTAVATASTTIFATPTATASSNSPVCFGQDIQLGLTTNGTKFAWTGPNGYNSTSQSPLITNATTVKGGVYTVIVSNINSCSVTATTLVTVNAQLNGGNDLSICSPVSTAQLTLIAGATWSSEPTNPALTTVDVTGKVTGMTVDGTYVFYVTNTGGCKDTVNIYRNPKLDAGNDKTICSPKSTAKLLALNTGQTWKYFANGSTLPTPTIDNQGNVAGMTQDGTYLFILEQTADKYCADTIAVIRKPAPIGGSDQIGASGICEPQTTAKLQSATTGQTWSVATNSTGFGTVAIDATGTISKMTTNGIYIFVLTQGECTDSVKVERKAKPNAGQDIAICEPDSVAKLSAALTGFTWSALSTNPTVAQITANGNVTGLKANGVYSFILTNATGCTDTVTVTRNAKPDAGADLVGKLGICEPLNTAKLASALTGTEWKVGNKPTGTTPIINATTGVITGLTANGIYEFVLVNTKTLCVDTVKVERSAKPLAGVDQIFCADSTKYKLPNAPQNMAWSSVPSNPSGTQISATTGEIIGMTAVGDYTFVLMNLSGCTDTVKITRKAIPIFDLQTLQSSCTTGVANSDAQLVVLGFDSANKYDYNEGITYTGTKTFANATLIPSTGVLANNLTNPTTDKSYTVRVFNSNGCYIDKTIVLKTRVCECKPDVCVPFTLKKITKL
jgi:hypothetical protein